MEGWALSGAGKFYRPVKKAVSPRLDADVIAWLKKDGEGHPATREPVAAGEHAGG